MFPWTIPTELVRFIDHQFQRFGAPSPSDKSIDVVADFVINYVVEKTYFLTPAEVKLRYDRPGLTEPEKYQLLGPVEIRLKMQLFDPISIDQMHLVAWATLMFCWSEEGDVHVAWYKKTNTAASFRRLA